MSLTSFLGFSSAVASPLLGHPGFPPTTVLLVRFRADWLHHERAMKTAERETRKLLDCQLRADGAVGQNTPSLIAWGWKQEKFQRWGNVLTSPFMEQFAIPAAIPQRRQVSSGI